jgi:hypothetical protein
MKGLKGISAGKEFLMSLLATTVSIVLTFGTTAIVDRKKQRAEKREMVLMVMYDMRESLKECEQCQNSMRDYCDLQVDLVAHPEQFSDRSIELVAHYPTLFYTTTTENIFKSNVETISTIGNILFVETVSSFYNERDNYSKDVVTVFQEEGPGYPPLYEDLAAFEAPRYLYRGELFYQAMKRDFEECKALMKVSEEDLDVFSKERKRVEESLSGKSMTERTKEFIQENEQRNAALQKAREEGRKALGQD